MKRTSLTVALAVSLILVGVPVLATEVDAETEARVPALTAFHEVVYPLWHEAWPKKDVDALVALAPKVDDGVAAIAKAELPGILRDKKATWASAVERLKAIGKDIRNYNIIQISLRETDGVRFAFPNLLVWTEKGALPELDSLLKGARVALYGHFYPLKNAEYALELHVLETITKGGRNVDVLLDGRMPPTPTPTVTPTATPGPGLWKTIQKKLKIGATPVPTGTVTPEALPAAK